MNIAPLNFSEPEKNKKQKQQKQQINKASMNVER